MKRTSTFSAAGAQPNARGPKCRSMQNISKDNSEKEKPVMTEKNDNDDGEDAEDGDEETGNAGVRLNGNGEEKTPGKPDNSDGTNPQ